MALQMICCRVTGWFCRSVSKTENQKYLYDVTARAACLPVVMMYLYLVAPLVCFQTFHCILLYTEAITLKPEFIPVLRFELRKWKIQYFKACIDSIDINCRRRQDCLMVNKETQILQKK